MKKHFILLSSILLIAVGVSAQKEYKLAKSSGNLKLNVSGAVVEGYSGNEIIFSVPKGEVEEVDERAKGLRVINGSGFTDNTGIGLDVAVKGDEIAVNVVSKNNAPIITIKVPENIKVSFNNNSNINYSELILKNLKSEIEVSTSYNMIKLENNTGPMNIKTLYGSVDASFSADIKGPVSIVSVHGYVDVSLPSSAKANVELFTSYGKLYAAESLKIALDKKPEPTKVTGAYSYSSTNLTGVTISASGYEPHSDSIKGKINGGGADLILKSNYKNVYLRDK